MIYDVFTYNNEKEILDLRFNILYPFVDKFVIIEFDETFSGKRKSKYLLKDFPKNWEKFLDKIDYVSIPKSEYMKYSDMAKESPNVPKDGPEHWRREFCQKESIKDALADLNDDDVVFIGDVDEIWDPSKLASILTYACKLKLHVYTYYLNNQSSEEFWGTIVAQYRDIKDRCLNHLRTNLLSWTENKFGWHFTSMGGYENVKKKLEDSYTEDSYASPQVMGMLDKNIEDSTDFLFRDFTYNLDESQWPDYLKENKGKYKHLLKDGI